MSTFLQDISLFSAEVFMAVIGMVVLIYGVFLADRSSETSAKNISLITLFAFFISAVLVLANKPNEGSQLAFNDLFIVNDFVVFIKILLLFGSSLIVLISSTYLKEQDMMRFEYPFLILFATLGMMLMVSAHNLISLYMGLELQSLSLYVLAAFRRDTLKSTEAGLKYFVLGALSSGLILYGCSLLYGFTGSLDFAVVGKTLGLSDPINVGALFGVVFVLAGLAFKISAVPFHMWTPDVYEGAPTPVTAFFAVVPKIAAIALIMRIVIEPFGEITKEWQQILYFLSLASMVWGSIAAIQQTNIKRLMAYSSIGHVGYALIGLVVGTQQGGEAVLFYLTIYLFMSVGTFCCILMMKQKGRMLENIDDLAGLSQTRPVMAFSMAVFMFSMAGIPPLAGFFGKLYIFLSAVEAGFYVLAVIGVLSSVIACYYYIRIIKVMYFDETIEEFDKQTTRSIRWILTGTTAFTLIFFMFPTYITKVTEAAAKALY